MKVRDSILWAGASRRELAERFREPEGRLATTDGTNQAVGGGDPAQLYKYSGNLLQLGAFACLEFSQATTVTACGQFLSACENKKSAGGHSICQRMRKAVERQIAKPCYSICTACTFHINWVTSEPTSLHDEPSIHDNPSQQPFDRLLRLN
jgi:hypothetical protein